MSKTSKFPQCHSYASRKTLRVLHLLNMTMAYLNEGNTWSSDIYKRDGKRTVKSPVWVQYCLTRFF